MSQYQTGTADVTNGSQVVTGNDTIWLTNVSIGDEFKVVGVSDRYAIASVDADTQITLNIAYTGSTDTEVSYAITRDFTDNYDAPEVGPGDKEWWDNVTRAFNIFDKEIRRKAFDIEDHTTDTTVVLTDDDFGKIHLFSNTSECTVYLPPIASGDVGKWLEFRKKGSGNLVIRTGSEGDSIIESGSTIIFSEDDDPSFNNIILFVETATNYSCRGMYGAWETSSSSSSSSSRSSSSSSLSSSSSSISSSSSSSSSNSSSSSSSSNSSSSSSLSSSSSSSTG